MYKNTVGRSRIGQCLQGDFGDELAAVLLVPLLTNLGPAFRVIDQAGDTFPGC